jgi:hypothetical protein
MCKYKRNIKQIEEAGHDAKTYFQKKFHEGCVNLKSEIAKLLNQTGNTTNLISEIANIMNCMFYISIVMKIRYRDIAVEMERRLDSEYERGCSND